MSELVEFSVWYNQYLNDNTTSAGAFAQKAGLSRAASYFYKSGDRVPDRSAMVRIAAAMGVAVKDMPQFAPKTKA